MSAPESSLVGRISEIQTGRLVATLFSGEQGFAATLKLGDEVLPIGQIGSLVQIRDRVGHILAEITRSYETLETRPGADGSGIRVVRERHVELMPLGEVNDAGELEMGVSRFPVVGAAVHLIPSRRLAAMLMRDLHGLLRLGRLSARPALDATVDPSALFTRHLAILGQTGAGKSWTVSALLQKTVAAMPHAHVILLDLHGEYGWPRPDGRREGIFAPRTARYLDASELEIPYWLLAYAELVDLFVDRADPNATVQIAFLRDLLYALRCEANPQLPQDTLTVDSPVYFSLDELYDRIKKANEEKLDFGRAKGPLFGAFDDFLVRFQSLYNDARHSFFMRPQRHADSASLEGLLRDFVGLGRPRRAVTVIDLSPVPIDLRPVIAAQIGRLAYEFNFWNPRREQYPLLLVCEEAHHYIPRGGDQRYESSRRAMERIAKEGRKYGVSLCVVSQRPTELSETVLSQCANFFCLRITNADDQAFVRRLLPGGAQNLSDVLAGLRRGELLSIGDALMFPTRILVDPPDPRPMGNQMPLARSWSDDPGDLDVAGIVERWRNQLR